MGRCQILRTFIVLYAEIQDFKWKEKGILEYSVDLCQIAICDNVSMINVYLCFS